MNKHERDEKILELRSQGISSRGIALLVFGRESCKSTVNDVITRFKKASEPSVCGDKLDMNAVSSHSLSTDTEEVFKIVTSKTSKDGCNHMVIPDNQVKPGVDTTYLKHIGQYIVDRKPDVIISLGDFSDIPSLSSYDKGKRAAEGQRVNEDIEATIEGMKVLLKPLYELQQQELKDHGKILYKPRMVLTLGNHEDRITRHVNANPELHGFLSIDNLRYGDFGWEVIPFLQPEVINGVAYVHFASNPFTGRPYGGAALNILKHVGTSMTVGHKQCLDVATRNLPTTGQQQWFVCAGACYTHDEGYKGPQGNYHFRGVIVKHGVIDGGYSPMFVNLEYLQDKFK